MSYHHHNLFPYELNRCHHQLLFSHMTHYSCHSPKILQQASYLITTSYQHSYSSSWYQPHVKAIDASYTHRTPIQLQHPIVVLNLFNLQPLSSSYPSILGYIHLILPQLTFLTSPFYLSIPVVPYSNLRFRVQLTKVIMIYDQPLLDNYNLFISPHVDTTTYSLDLLFRECYTPHDFIRVLCNPAIPLSGTM